MNSLSWFLYAADVINNVGGVLLLTALACVLFCIVALIGQAATEGELSSDCPNMWKYWRRCAVAAVALGIFAGLFPSRNTMYAIAVSQAGEQVAKSEAVQGIASDATKALQLWIKRQIEPEKK